MKEKSATGSSFSMAALGIRLVGWLPYWLSTRLFYGLAWLLSWLPLTVGSAYRTILVNLLICYPEKPYEEVKQLARSALGELAWTLADCAHCWTHSVNKNLKRVSQLHGYDVLESAMQSEQPVLLLGLHQSSWELLSVQVGQLGEVTVFYQPDDDPALNQLVTHARERNGSKLVPANTTGMKAALVTMARGGSVGILVDHQPGKASANPWTRFFGQPVRSSNLPFKLIKRFKPRVFFTSAQRVNGKVELHFIEACEELYNADDEVTALNLINAGLEDIINLAPAQYQWSYKRFHRTPAGRRPIYKKKALPALQQVAEHTNRDSLGFGRYSEEATEWLCQVTVEPSQE